MHALAWLSLVCERGCGWTSAELSPGTAAPVLSDCQESAWVHYENFDSLAGMRDKSRQT